MQNIAVIGAGAMGRQIALKCAMQGFRTGLHDRDRKALADVIEFADSYLDGRIKKGKLTPEAKEATLGRFNASADLASVARDADLVIEAIIEEFDAKAALFGELGTLCRADAILATNSSNIYGSRLAVVTDHPERVLNLHFFNPALVMELVEVVVHPQVDEAALARAVTFCRELGKIPVVLRQEVPGFIVNRIFRALTREALSLYEQGYATAEDIDLAVTKGLGHPIGPLRLLDMTGIDVSYLARMDEYRQTGLESARPNRILEELYRNGNWGRKSGKGFYVYPEDGKAG